MNQSIPENENAPTKIEDTKTFLDKLAIGIIAGVVFVLLLAFVVFLSSIKTNNPSSINFKLDSVHLTKLDSNFIIANQKFIDSLNNKIELLKIATVKLSTIKNEMEDTQKKNEDYFKLILALVGSVFAIVGFFGFKSISDTRQATLDAAKIKAETVAENSAKTKAESIIKSYLKEEAESIMTVSATKTASEVATTVATSIAYETANKTAKQIAFEEVNKLTGEQKEFQRASRQDMIALEQEYNILRSRITELEAKLYGSEPDDEEKNKSQGEETPVV